jgi:hypothetical protein
VLREPINVYKLTAGRLFKQQDSSIPEGRNQRVLVGLTKGNCRAKECFLIGTQNLVQGAVDPHCWTDGRSIFESTTGHLRHLIAKKPREEHVGIRKWRLEIPDVPPGLDI